MDKFSKSEIGAVVKCPKTRMVVTVPKHRINTLYKVIDGICKKTGEGVTVVMGHRVFNYCSHYDNKKFWFMASTTKPIENLDSWSLISCKATKQENRIIFEIISAQ